MDAEDKAALAEIKLSQQALSKDMNQVVSAMTSLTSSLAELTMMIVSLKNQK